MIVNNVTLECVAVRPNQYPTSDLPEIAFAGKSNVGKSSLINTMINRKALARTSGAPGKTRTINFYNVEDMVYFVDLPGYGYAKAPDVEIKKWGEMIEKYLLDRKQLCSIIMLVDIRHEPGAQDIMMYEWLKYYGYKIIIVATKHDKLKKSQVSANVKQIRDKLKLDSQDMVIPFSSESKQGREELWQVIKGFVAEQNVDSI
jgi:GTP-binding protein